MNTRILLIEDEIELSENIKGILELNNYKVICAYDGADGIRKAKELMPDCIISDILMPKKDGYQVLNELNSDGRTSLIPFIFLTAKVDYNDLRKGMELGADDYIFKPFTAKQLLAAIGTRIKKSELLKGKLVDKNETPSQRRYSSGESVLFSINKNYVFVKIDRIKFIAAKRQYTDVVLKDNKRIVVRKSLNEWETSLPEELFIRVSRSVIININEIDKIIKMPNGTKKIILSDTKNEIFVSRRYSKILKEMHSI